MNLRRFFISLSALGLVFIIAAYVVLVPSEAERPPPPGITQPNLKSIQVPFTHRWVRGATHPLLAAAAIDIDGDGRDEVFLGGSDGQADALISWQDGRLVDLAAKHQLGDDLATYGALSLDLDHDGDVDLLTTGKAGLVFWENHNARFRRRIIDIALPADAVPMAVTAADYDRDGDVDLYLSMFVAAKSFRSPVFNDPEHAKANILLRNEGNLAFKDVTDKITAGLQNTFTASFADLDQDGWPDLVLAQNTGEVELLRNLGKGVFERAAVRTGFGFWMGLAFGDIDRDGDLDIFLSNSGNSVPPWLVNGDRRDDQPPAAEWLLLRNDGGFHFKDVTADYGMTGFGFAWGGVFTDINLDGAIDLLVAQNYVKWPVHKLFRLPGKLLLADPKTASRVYTSDAAANPGYGHTPLLADLDGDGRLDIVWANMDGRAQAYLNQTRSRFISLRLPDTPQSIGARVSLDGIKAPLITNIAGQGLTSDQSTLLMFGLGPDGQAPEAVTIKWADGRKTRIERPSLNRVLTVDTP